MGLVQRITFVEVEFNAINIIDYTGTFVFAVSGIMMAVDKKFDFFGAIILAFVTAIGGGTIRDLLIGINPVSWITSNIHVLIILSAVPISYLLYDYFKVVRRAFWIFDTLGIGLFTILGLEIALENDISVLMSIMMGVASAVFGGIIRDVLSNEVPLIFQKEVYAFACLFGAIVYVALGYFQVYDAVKMPIAIASVITIRLLSIKYNWSIPFNPLRRKS